MSYSLSQKVQSSCYSTITFVLVASKRNRSDYIFTAHRGVVHFYNHPILFPSLIFVMESALVLQGQRLMGSDFKKSTRNITMKDVQKFSNKKLISTTAPPNDECHWFSAPQILGTSNEVTKSFNFEIKVSSYSMYALVYGFCAIKKAKRFE